MNLRSLLTSSSLALLLPACAGGAGDGRVAEPSEVGDALSKSLVGHAAIAPVQLTLAQGLFSLPTTTPSVAVTPESCQEVENLIFQSCSLLANLTGDAYCYGEATYFLAHSTPRCAGRLHLAGDGLEDIYAFDLSGQPLQDVDDSCGDGVLDAGEQCDDGNREDWDGCSATCNIEEFQGCEAVIEQYYEQAGIAFVDKSRWDGPRSHVMVNTTATPLTAVNQQSCDAALAIGADVCNQLITDMPFVGSCQPVGGLRTSEAGEQCDVRFLVYFDQVEPNSGVFTTALPGFLAFSIK